jgi:hypothetical protein
VELFMVGAGVLVMANAVGFVELVLSGCVEAFGALRRVVSGRASDGSLVRGVLRLGLAVLVAAAPFHAVDRVERANDWADEDGNGLLDPKTEGPYYWVDVNGDDLVRTWGVIGVALTGTAALTYRPRRWRWRWSRQRAPTSPE